MGRLQGDIIACGNKVALPFIRTSEERWLFRSYGASLSGQ